MTTRNKRRIRLVSPDDHKTLTPLIASKLQMSRVTARFDPNKSRLFTSPSNLSRSLLYLFLPSFSARCTHCTSEWSPRQSPSGYRARRRRPKNPERRPDVLSYVCCSRPNFLSRARLSLPIGQISSRDNFHEVVLANSPSFLVPSAFSSSPLSDRLHFSIAIRVPRFRSTDRISRPQYVDRTFLRLPRIGQSPPILFICSRGISNKSKLRENYSRIPFSQLSNIV